ncbi:MAG: acyltransferase [Flavobacteriales bacterium BRH_c54]|nr:MAG: acyltransferase [Flavobacteriales bacterium BRH_c54]
MKKTEYFENLDGLRFFSFLSVFFFHSFHTNSDYLKSLPIYDFIKFDVFGEGNLGVNFFFVLSGFLITYLLIKEKKINAQINIKLFLIRRVLRIWPLFFFCVGFGFLIFPQIKLIFGQTPNETANPIYYLTFLNNFDFIRNGPPDSSVLGILWSIAIEEQFYLIWPLILFVFPIKKFWIPFSLIILLSLLFRAFNDDYLLHELHTLSCIGDMAVGAFGAWLILEFNSFKLKIQQLNKMYIAFIYIFTIIVYFFRSELLYSSFEIRIFERLIVSIIFLFVILEQNYAQNSFYKLSNLKYISKLGKITYGLYCLHFIGILISINLTKMFSFNTSLWQVLLLETSLALIITIVISKISYRYLESPFLRLKNKFNSFDK